MDQPAIDSRVEANAPSAGKPGEPTSGSDASDTCTDGPAISGQAVFVVSGAAEIVQVFQAPSIGEESDSHELTGTRLDELWPGESPGRLSALVKRAIRSREVVSGDFATADGDVHYDIVFVPHGPDRVLVVGRDVSERKQQMTRLEELAYLDDITKLPNRQFLFEELRRCTDTLGLQEGRAALICLEIQTTQSVAGRRTSGPGDETFIEVATRLAHELRGANDLEATEDERYTVAARLERNRFGVLLPLIEDGGDAENVAGRLIATLEEPIQRQGRIETIRCRAGIALYPQDGKDAQTLYTNAVAALDDAVNSDSTPCKFHSGTVRLRALQRQDLEAELRAALEQNEFSIEYLPIVTASDRRIVSFEALLRWPRNMFGAQTIRKVVSVAEHTGLILPIGEWVLRQSCEALTGWRSSGLPDLRLSVNLSAQEFSRDDVAERIAEILAEADVDPTGLDVEINEYSLFRDAMRNYAQCDALRELGVGIVIDDYGTGACSLTHLASSPAVAVKIDTSFVSGVVGEGTQARACAAISALAKQLEMATIAEGVETEAQAERLAGFGCNFLQGFLASRPLAAEHVPELLEGRRSK